MNIQPGYESLAGVLQRALDQAQTGKGAERHGLDAPFEEQTTQLIGRMLNSSDGMVHQAIKKATESRRLPAGRDVAELLGAINYLAGAVIFLESQQDRLIGVYSKNTDKPVECSCGSSGQLHRMWCTAVPQHLREKNQND